ncbi:MAG: 2-amino-4-hydroxy-6-hydroxymethyldihydropteridine diphosphokinase [Candidatus Zixiibacteriota bacterium]
MPQTVYLGLGSNLGDRENNLLAGCRLISAMEGFETIDISPLYVTEAVEMSENSPSFLNMALKGQFNYTPLELLANIENIEKQVGRRGKGDYQPRSLDIDILLFGDKECKMERLIVPHPRMTKRPFVLVPLLQIDPDLVHPLTKKRFDSYLKKKDRQGIILYKEFSSIHVNT